MDCETFSNSFDSCCHNMANDLFKIDFKHYKARCPPPDLKNVISLDNSQEEFNNAEPIIFEEGLISSEKILKCGLKPLCSWRAYKLKNVDGLILVKNPFFGVGQRYWSFRCLKSFTRKPNKLNIDIDGELPGDWWECCHTGNMKQDEILRKKMRWATLGYHHDWDSKHYQESSKHLFPGDLSELCSTVAECLGFKNFLPQASIVNFYHMDSTLAPHTDHSENNLEAPLLSISFGQSAIFLIGGETKETKPVALFLNSGDIVIMSNGSRLCYHAVPKILKTDSVPWSSKEMKKEEMENPEVAKEMKKLVERYDDFKSDVCDETAWRPFDDYLKESRININVRQVLHPNQKCLNDGH